MPKSVPINIQFPFGGYDARMSERAQPPYTSPDCKNVRPNDAFPKEHRKRGASRPGMAREFMLEDGSALGSGNPINLLTQVTAVSNDRYDTFLDHFDGDALMAHWEAASWIPDLPDVLTDFASVEYHAPVGAVLAGSAITNLNTSSAYEISIFIATYAGVHHGDYEIYARMDNTTPDATADGIIARLNLSDEDDGTSDFSGELTVYSSGTPTQYSFTGGTDVLPRSGWFKVLINGNDISCFWNENVLLNAQTISAPAGSLMGFGMECLTAGGFCFTDIFQVQYFVDVDWEGRRTWLIAASGGTLYHEDRHGVMVPVANGTNLHPTNPLMAVERGQKLYIADYSDLKVSGSDGTFAGTSLTAASVADWTALSIDPDADMITITGGAGGVEDGTYQIASVAAGSLTLAVDVGTGTGSYKVQRGPKVYDPLTDTLSLWTAEGDKGIVPVGCEIIELYRDRLVLGKDRSNPWIWYASRQGDPRDWDYFPTEANDPGRAIYASLADAGEIGAPITAIISHSDDYLIVGCNNSLWMLRGDPAIGGQNDAVSYFVGITDKRAYAKTPDGALVFLSDDGLYAIPLGGNSAPQSISHERMPQELKRVDPLLVEAVMGYDPSYRGIWLHTSARNGTSDRHWYFDWEDKSFWPDDLPNAFDPFSSHYYVADVAEHRWYLVGCRDGYIRLYKDVYETDESNLIDSYCDMGIIKLGFGEEFEGKFNRVTAVMAQDSGSVTWSCRGGKSHEGAVDADTFASGTWTYDGNKDGLNYWSRPRMRAASMVLRITGTGSQRWAIEKVMGEVLNTRNMTRLM